ncbi:SDR family NAD(P)-dependent oxidoreductase [Phytohabitans sp. LJ34]|uniref:SDR family NAD(P)-dependent oxidoreductase n=1 Tax=Phytohabitans sp. LJ34 TaxID=3452217 RepID=UPI003F8C169E
MSTLEGKVALVTGGSRGIGAAIATRLAKEGADVALTYATTGERAKSVADAIKAEGRRGLPIQADSADPQAVVAAVERTVAEFGRFDILVNNAGNFPYGPIDKVTLEEIDTSFAIHVKSAFVAAQAALPHMREGGRIISIGSCWAERVPVTDVTLYSLCKTALIGFTRGLARDLGPRGITVNLVHPGPTDTEMNPASDPAAESERLLTALGRYGTPDEIAATVAHLAGEGGNWITGAQFSVDGGYAA